jgi:hypothetical protein
MWNGRFLMKIDVTEEGILRLKKVFNPVLFETGTDKQLIVQMRDDGFEICVSGLDGSASWYCIDEHGTIECLGEVRAERPEDIEPLLFPAEKL